MPMIQTEVMKEVLLLTPVLLSRVDFAATHQPKRYAYHHGQQLT